MRRVLFQQKPGHCSFCSIGEKDPSQSARIDFYQSAWVFLEKDLDKRLHIMKSAGNLRELPSRSQ
jgi:hypothetical protein